MRLIPHPKGVCSFHHVARAALITVALAFTMAGCSQEAKVSRHLKRGDQYFKEDEYEKAKIEYLNVLKLDGKNTAAIRQLGIIWSEQASALRAIPFLLKAKELEPANAEVRTRLAYNYGALRQVDEARKEALAALDHAPANSDALLFLVDTARTDEELATAREKLQSAGMTGSTLDHIASAHVALRKRDVDGAEAALKKAVESDVKSAPAHSALGNVYLRRGKIKEGSEEFKLAADLASPRSPIRLKYADYLNLAGKPEEADAWLDSVTKAAPDFFPAWIHRAQSALAKQKYDDALTHLQRVFGSDPANFDGRLLEGQIYVAKGDAKKAIELLGNLNSTYPGIPPTRYHLARAYLKAADMNQAGALLDQAIASEPNYLEAILLRAEINLRTGNAAAVVNSMTSVLAKNPELGQAQLLLASAYQLTGRSNQALSMLQGLVEKNPKNTQAQWLLAVALRQQGKKAEARAAFEKLQTMTPGSLAPLSQLVQMDVEEKDFAGALKKLDDRLAKEPNAVGALVFKGRVFAIQGNWERAEAELKRAIEIDPNQVSAYQLLSSVYVASGRLPQAIEQLNGLLAKSPDNPQTLMMSAVLHGEAKNMAKAREQYEKLLEKQPDSPAALNNLAWLKAEEYNDLSNARDLARKARSLRPTDPAITDTLGWVLYKSGEYQQALTLIKEAAAELGDNPEVLYHLGMANYTMGDQEGARIAFGKAAESKTDFPGKEQIETRLALLGGGEGHGVSIDQLQEIIKSNPRDTLAWVRLAEVNEKKGSFAEAAGAYDKAIEINPSLLAAVVRSAELNAAQLKNSEKALKLVKAARLLATEDPAVSARLGIAAYEAGDFTQSYGLLQESYRAKQVDPKGVRTLAWAAYSLGRVQEARDLIEKLPTLNAPQPLIEDGQLFLKMTASDSSAKVSSAEIEETLKAQPNYVPALMLRAAAYSQAGNKQGAVETYNQVLRVTPKFPPAQVKLAAILLQSPETRAQGHELAQSAQKALPEDAEAMKTLGESNYHRKEYAATVRLLEEGGKSSPLTARELFYVGMARSKTAPGTAAIDALQRSVHQGLEEPLLSEAKRVLAESKGTN
jgi:tetratricopeptide (TPR) repeat protein